MLVQRAVSGGTGKGISVSILPENVWWDVQLCSTGCPSGPVRLSPAPHVREMLSFLPSSCFLPDGNSLPNFLLLVSPLATQTHDPTEITRGVGQGGLDDGGCIAAGSPHICLCAQKRFYFLSLCVIISGVSGC